MKKYRLKEEVKKWFLEYDADAKTIDDWRIVLGNIKLEAFEEVEQRIELYLNIENGVSYLVKGDEGVIYRDEKDLCEKAINGELVEPMELLSEFATYTLTHIGQCYETEIITKFLKQRK